MSWPWSELGLDGPSSLEEIRRAYAERTKQTHPEEDPEGFQRLHAAYQLARRLAKKKDAAAERPDFAEKRADEPLEKSQDKPEDKKGWDYARIFAEESRDKKDEAPSGKESAAAGSWDYERLFAEAAQESEAKRRREMQARSGLTDENDGWEQVVPALREMDAIQREGLPLARLQTFLGSPTFERVRESTTFILALEDWICASTPMEFSAQRLLLERLGLLSGRVPPMYKKIHALLGYSDAADHRYGKQGYKKERQKQLFRVIAVCILVCSIMTTFMTRLSPAAQKRKHETQVMQWLSEDLGMTVEPYQGSVPVGGEEELRFRAKEMPEFVFSAEYQGDRDVEQGALGYKTNFSAAAFDWRLRQLALDSAYQLRERNGWNWSKGEGDHTPAYFLEFPLVEAEEAVQKLDEMYQTLRTEHWYQENPPKYKLQFSRSGVCYFTLDAPVETFDAPAVAEYCKKTAPEAICGFIIKTTGLDEKDFSSDNYGVFQMKPGLPLEDSDFYFEFVAIDADSNEMLRLYAYSEKENELVSFPVEEYVKGRTFSELKQKCSPFDMSKQTEVRFPKLFRWA